MTCVSGSLPKTNRIGRSAQLFYLFSESATKIYGRSGNLKHFFLGLIFRNADFLFIMLGQREKLLFPLTRHIKREGSVKYVISERGKKNSKTCDSERYQFNQLNFLKMLQNNLNLEYVENNVIVQKTHLTAKYEFY